MIKKILYILIITLVSCSEINQKKISNPNNDYIAHNVLVQMENQTFNISEKNLEPQILNITKDSIQFELWEDGNPIKVNFNLFNTDILNQSNTTYQIPDVNSTKVKVDLNLYNGERNVKPINKRIIFRKGTINITKITERELRMTFEGEGSGIMEYGKNFPITGKVHLNY